MNTNQLNEQIYYEIPAVQEILDMITVCTDPIKNPPEIDKEHNTAVFRGKNIDIILSNYTYFNNVCIPTTVYLVLFVLLHKQHKENTPIINLTIKEYSVIREENNARNTGKQLDLALKYLSNLSFSKNGQTIPICTKQAERKRGLIYFSFSEHLISLLSDCHMLHLPKTTFSMNLNLCQHAFYISVYLESLRCNLRLNQNHIKIRFRDLLEHIPKFSCSKFRGMSFKSFAKTIAIPISNNIDAITSDSLQYHAPHINKVFLDDLNSLDLPDDIPNVTWQNLNSQCTVTFFDEKSY